MFKSLLIGFTESIKVGLDRFLSSFIHTILLFLTFSYSILTDSPNRFRETISNIEYSLFFGFVFSVLIVLLFENKNADKYLAHLISVIPTITCFTILNITNISETYFFVGYLGIILATACVILLTLHTSQNKNTIIPHILKSIFFAGVVSSIIIIGFIICIAAIHNLIYKFEDFYDIVLIIAAFSYIVVFLNTVISYLPKRSDVLTIPKLFKVIVLYIAFPIYITLLTIMYVYLMKIVVTLNMPAGQINIFATLASAFFIFFYFTLMQYEEKLVKLYIKAIGYIILPVIVMQIIALYIRINAYGLTTMMVISIIYVAITIIFAIYAIVGKCAEKGFIFVAIFALIFTLSPVINIMDLPVKQQTKTLEKYLIKHDMLVDGKIIPNSSVPEEDKEIMMGSFRYIYYSNANKPDYMNFEGHINPEEVLGFTYDDHSFYKWYHGDIKDVVIDVTEYKKLIKIDEYSENLKNYKFNVDNIEYTIDINKLVEFLNLQNTVSYEIDKLIEFDGFSILIDSFNYRIDSDKKISEVSLHGYALIK